MIKKEQVLDKETAQHEGNTMASESRTAVPMALAENETPPPLEPEQSEQEQRERECDRQTCKARHERNMMFLEMWKRQDDDRPSHTIHGEHGLASGSTETPVRPVRELIMRLVSGDHLPSTALQEPLPRLTNVIRLINYCHIRLITLVVPAEANAPYGGTMELEASYAPYIRWKKVGGDDPFSHAFCKLRDWCQTSNINKHDLNAKSFWGMLSYVRTTTQEGVSKTAKDELLALAFMTSGWSLAHTFIEDENFHPCDISSWPGGRAKANQRDACRDFARGFCEWGSICRKKHIDLCPTFTSTQGYCAQGDLCEQVHFKDLPILPARSSSEEVVGDTPLADSMVESGVASSSPAVQSSRLSDRPLKRKFVSLGSPDATLDDESPKICKISREEEGHPDPREPCRDFARGLCTKALSCKHSHLEPHTKPVCGDFMKGSCWRGSLCKFTHPALACSNCYKEGHHSVACQERCRHFAKGFCKIGRYCHLAHGEPHAVVCYVCFKTGHMPTACPSRRIGNVTCYLCNKVGHYATGCAVGANDPITCFRCGETGHFANGCPEAANPAVCPNCNTIGHFDSQCGLSNEGGSRNWFSE
jgi:hypothetical protein